MSAAIKSSSKAEPFNQWPNDLGFEVFCDQKKPVELKVTGQIPRYAAGVLLRTGPGGYQISAKDGSAFSMSHWFDGFSQVHRFEIIPDATGREAMRVTYSSQHTSEQYLDDIRESGTVGSISFGQMRDPCESLFRKIMSSFHVIMSPKSRGKSGHNVGVTIQRNLPGGLSESRSVDEPGTTSSIQSLWLKTDNAHIQEIDPTTLEPIQIISQDAFDPSLKGPLTGAHARTDPTTGDLYNYNLEIGRQPTYRIFVVSALTDKTTVLATVSDPAIQPAYIHSMFLTQHYVVLCVFDAYFAAGGAKMLWTRNMLEAMYFDPQKKNKWLVIDRVGSKGLVGVFESEPYFAFHSINAWEEKSSQNPDAVDITLEIPAFENLDILKRFYYENLKATAAGSRAYVGENQSRARPQFTRWKLSDVTNTTKPASTPPQAAERVFILPAAETMELPTFNPLFAMKPSRYVYGCSDRGESTFLDGLVKLDTQTHVATHWNVHAHSPGEPIFVPNPQEGVAEDDGVLLSVVLDGIKGTSYLLVLDAKTFTEIGRASMDVAFPFGFHGTHIASG